MKVAKIPYTNMKMSGDYAVECYDVFLPLYDRLVGEISKQPLHKRRSTRLLDDCMSGTIQWEGTNYEYSVRLADFNTASKIVSGYVLLHHPKYIGHISFGLYVSPYKIKITRLSAAESLPSTHIMEHGVEFSEHLAKELLISTI